MIALRPLHGKFAGKLTWTVMEGRKIPEQILALLDVKKCLKDGVIKSEKEDKKDKTVDYSASEDKEVSGK